MGAEALARRRSATVRPAGQGVAVVGAFEGGGIGPGVGGGTAPQLVDRGVVGVGHPRPQVALHQPDELGAVVEEGRGHHGDVGAGQERLGHVGGGVHAGGGRQRGSIRPRILKGLNKHFGGIQAVSDCTFSVDQGTITSLIGPNGAGKTTVFNLVTGLLSSDFGEVIFLGKKITGLQPHDITRKGSVVTFKSRVIYRK